MTGLLFVLPLLVTILPAGFSNSIRPYLPGNAAQAIMSIGPKGPHATALGWAGVFAAYAFAAIAGGAALFIKRDA